MGHPTRIGGIAGEMFLYVYIYHDHGLPQKKVKQGLAISSKWRISGDIIRFMELSPSQMDIYTTKKWVAKELWKRRWDRLIVGEDYVIVTIVQREWWTDRKWYVSMKWLREGYLASIWALRVEDKSANTPVNGTFAPSIRQEVNGTNIDKLRAIQDKILWGDRKN